MLMRFLIFDVLAIEFTVWSIGFFNFRGSGQAVQIVKRHHFASYLKRMSVVVRVQEEFLAFVKVYWLLFLLMHVLAILN